MPTRSRRATAFTPTATRACCFLSDSPCRHPSAGWGPGRVRLDTSFRWYDDEWLDRRLPATPAATPACCFPEGAHNGFQTAAFLAYYKCSRQMVDVYEEVDRFDRGSCRGGRGRGRAFAKTGPADR